MSSETRRIGKDFLNSMIISLVYEEGTTALGELAKADWIKPFEVHAFQFIQNPFLNAMATSVVFGVGYTGVAAGVRLLNRSIKVG